MSQQYDDNAGKIDPSDVPDIDVGTPRIETIPKWRAIGAVVLVLSLAGGGAVALAKWSGGKPRVSERETLATRPADKKRAVAPLWTTTVKPVREPEPPPMPTEPTEEQPKIYGSKAEADQAAKAAGFEPRDQTINDEAQAAVDAESLLLRGASQSDRNVAAHRSGSSPYAASTGQRDREVEDGDEDAYYRPAWPKRDPNSSGPHEPLQPPQTGLGGLSELSSLAGLAGKAKALEAMAAQGQDDEDRREAFASRDGIQTEGGTEAIGECDLPAGRPIRGNLKVATNSDLPSGTTVTIEVAETIRCGGARQHIAIPQGSKFVGEVNQRVGYGAERQQLCMKQLDRPPTKDSPNGDRTRFKCQIVADIQGAPGMVADVDNHWGQVIGGSILSAILGMGPSIASGNQAGFAPTIAQQGAAQAGQNLNQAGQRIVQRELSRKPTLTTPILEGVVVLLASNLDLRPWVPRAAPRTKPKQRITWVRRPG